MVVETIRGLDETAVEISKERGRISFVLRFSEDIAFRKTIPTIVLWRAWLEPESLEEQFTYVCKHPEMVEELPQLVRLIKQKKASVIYTPSVGEITYISYAEDDKRINEKSDRISIERRPSGEVFISNSPAIERYNLIIVPEEKFLKTLKKLLK